MKRLFVVLTLAGAVLSVSADLTGNGYYRVLNYGSNRWANLIDNQATVDKIGATADLHSLELTTNKEAILSDPGSIVMLTQVSGYQYDISTQGTTFSELVDQPINIRQSGTGNDNQAIYYIYGVYKNVTKYIGDSDITNGEIGFASVNANKEANNKWYILPVSASSDNFFGVVPDVTAKSGKYTTTFASFGFKPYSANVKAYYVGRVGYGMVELIEVTGAVPPGSPVVIQCAGDKATDNKMELVQLQETLPNNSLSGAYFDYTSKQYNNKVDYNPSTMRVLGTLPDGSLGFVTSSTLQIIPGNTAYLTVPAGTPSELRCVTTSEYDAALPQAPEGFYFGDDEYYEILPQGSDTYSGNFTLPQPENGPIDLKLRFNTVEEDYFIGASSSNNSDVIVTGSNNTTWPFEYQSPYYWIIPNWNGGDLSITINILYEYVQIVSANAGVNMISAGKAGIVFDGTTFISNKGNGIALFDLAGKEIVKTSGNELNVSKLPKGIYIVKANGESIKVTL